MRIGWLCPLIEYPRPGFWCPAVVRLHDGPTGAFPTIWTTTDARRAHPWACGVAEVTEGQLAAMQAEGTIHIFPDATERAQAFGRLSRVRRAALNQYLQQIALPPARTTEGIEALLTRIIRANEPTKTLDSLLEDLTQRGAAR